MGVLGFSFLFDTKYLKKRLMVEKAKYEKPGNQSLPNR